MQDTYTLIVDNGKPSEENNLSLSQLIKRLSQLKTDYDNNKEDYFYFDIMILKNDIDITEHFFNLQFGMIE